MLQVKGAYRSIVDGTVPTLYIIRTMIIRIFRCRFKTMTPCQKKSVMVSSEVIQRIRDIDSSEVLGSGAIESPVMGVISPTSLSGGVKTLIFFIMFVAAMCRFRGRLIL